MRMDFVRFRLTWTASLACWFDRNMKLRLLLAMRPYNCVENSTGA